MKKYKKLTKNKFIYLLITLLALTIFNFIDNKDNTSYAFNNDEVLTAHFIDVNQGDANFIELPNNKTILIDSGEKEYGNKILEYINNLGYNKIDYVIGTHPHSDHIGGLIEIVKNIDIDNIYMPKAKSNSPTYITLLKEIKNKNYQIHQALNKTTILEDNNLKISILSPDNKEYKNLNNYSVVLKITYKNISFLYMGDAEKEIEKELLKNNFNNLQADIIKIGHHGSNTSSTNEFINKVNAKYGVIEVGKNNIYDHPNNEIIKRWENHNTKIYRTDINGNIIIKTDGNNIIIDKEK